MIVIRWYLSCLCDSYINPKPAVINPCLADDNHCVNRSECREHGILNRAQDAMLAELGRENFAGLAGTGTTEEAV